MLYINVCNLNYVSLNQNYLFGIDRMSLTLHFQMLNIKKGFQIDAVYVDLSKAFDRV